MKSSRANEFTVVACDGSVHTSRHPLELLRWCPAHHLEVFDEINRRLPGAGFQFVLTWRVDDQPYSGRNIVLMLLGDEQGQVPLSADKVLAVFRSGTDKLALPPPPWRSGGIQWLLQLARMGRNMLKRMTRAFRPDCSWNVPSNVFTIPIGTMSPAPDHIIPPTERTYDVTLFATVGRRLSLGPIQIPFQPKTPARNEALNAMRKLANEMPELQMKAGCPDDRRWGERVSPSDYLDVLVKTRIAPCPRGNFAETFRHYEAARAGCVIVSDPLPDEWYFQDHPFVILDRWSQFPETVMKLKSIPDELERLSQASLSWWKNKTCPAAVAKHMAEKLLELRPELVPCVAAMNAST